MPRPPSTPRKPVRLRTEAASRPRATRRRTAALATCEGEQGITGTRRRSSLGPGGPSDAFPCVSSVFLLWPVYLLWLRLEVERHAVDAVAQPGRRRAVGKHVTEVTAALAAVHFGANHEVAVVIGCSDRALDRLEEAGPPGAAFEFPCGDEQLLAAACTGEGARALLLQQRAGAGPLGRMLSQDLVLLRRQ